MKDKKKNTSYHSCMWFWLGISVSHSHTNSFCLFPTQFLCLKNIRTFLVACSEIFSMKKSELFEAFDLFDVRDFGKVRKRCSVTRRRNEVWALACIHSGCECQLSPRDWTDLVERAFTPTLVFVSQLWNLVKIIYKQKQGLRFFLQRFIQAQSFEISASFLFSSSCHCGSSFFSLWVLSCLQHH